MLASGAVAVLLAAGCATAGTPAESVAKTFTAAVDATGGWEEFRAVSFGRLEIKQAGKMEIRVRPANPQTWKPVNLREIVLAPR